MLRSVRRVLALSVSPLLLVGACKDAVSEKPRGGRSADDGSDAATVVADAGQPRRPGVLRVATFNVRRYFDVFCDSGACTPGSFEELPTEAEFRSRTAAIGAALARIDADVVALQEIENARCLEALRDDAAGRGLGYVTTELGETGAPASVDVAVFARAPATEIRTHRHVRLQRPDGSTTTFSRELLEVRMTFGARRVIAFAAHFRSKVDDDPGRRLAEAVATREIVSAASVEDPDALVVLGGDLNDEPGSPPLDALEEGAALVRVARDLPPLEQATFVFQNRAIAIDHLYVTASGAPRYVDGSAAVVRDVSSGLGGSDHGALQAELSLD